MIIFILKQIAALMIGMAHITAVFDCYIIFAKWHTYATSSNTYSFGPHEPASNPLPISNSILISLAIFAWLTIVTNTETDRHTKLHTDTYSKSLQVELILSQ